MSIDRRLAVWGMVFAGTVAGCGTPPVPPPETGAREAVRSYYTAIVRQAWSQAYAVLHPDWQARYSPEQFATFARNYRRGLGFEPHEVHVRSCEEQGTRAIAHVVLAGRTVAHSRQYKDAVVL